MNLKEKRCIPCEGGTLSLSKDDVERFSKETPLWKIGSGSLSIEREYRFPNFVDALVFVNDVAHIAEKEGHHPDIHISYNHVRLVLATHAAKGLTENDFILAAKIDADIELAQ